MFEKIKKWYEQGLWTADMVMKAVEKGVLTAEEAEEVMKNDTTGNEEEGSGSH